MIASINSDIMIYHKIDRYAANFDWKLEIKDLRISFHFASVDMQVCIGFIYLFALRPI